MQKSFFGYRRDNGRVGIRNHVLILPLDDLSQPACNAVANNIGGTVAIQHPYGRLQFGADLDLHFRTLIGAGSNPIVPVIKLSANPRTIRTMSEHMDVDVSGILRREMNLDQAGDKLLDMMFQTIAGRMTAAEALKQNQFVMTRLYESA